MKYTKERMLKDAAIGGVVGGLAVYAFTVWTGYEVGEELNDLLGVTQVYGRYTIDFICAGVSSSYGAMGGPAIGGTIGAAVGAFIRHGAGGLSDLGELAQDMYEEFERSEFKK